MVSKIVTVRKEGLQVMYRSIYKEVYAFRLGSLRVCLIRSARAMYLDGVLLAIVLT